MSIVMNQSLFCTNLCPDALFIENPQFFPINSLEETLSLLLLLSFLHSQDTVNEYVVPTKKAPAKYVSTRILPKLLNKWCN